MKHLSDVQRMALRALWQAVRGMSAAEREQALQSDEVEEFFYAAHDGIEDCTAADYGERLAAGRDAIGEFIEMG